MAISEDAVALVAAQLTTAWAQVFATKAGAGALTEDESSAKIIETYNDFRKRLSEGGYTPEYRVL